MSPKDTEKATDIPENYYNEYGELDKSRLMADLDLDLTRLLQPHIGDKCSSVTDKVSEMLDLIL